MSGKQNLARGGVPAQWGDTQEAPRTGIINPDRLQRRTRAYRFAVWFTVAAAPFLALALFVSIGRGDSTPAPATHDTTPAAETNSPGRAVATVTVENWLKQTPSPLPGGSILSWDGATSIRAATGAAAVGDDSDSSNTEANGTSIPEARYETYTFTLYTSSGAFWTAAVEVAVDSRPGGGAAAVTGVSITPVPAAASDGWDQDGPWPGVAKSNTASGPVSSAVQAWATAYTSGNAGTLAQAVQDPSPDHAYEPISGVAAVSPSVLYGAAAPGQDREMLEVSLGITWDGEAAPAPGQTRQNSTPTVMDLLVANANTPAPVVVAWGPPGSGPTLRPYQNAIDGNPPAGSQSSTGGPSKYTPAPATSPAETAAPAPSAAPSRTAAKPSPARTPAKKGK